MLNYKICIKPKRQKRLKFQGVFYIMHNNSVQSYSWFMFEFSISIEIFMTCKRWAAFPTAWNHLYRIFRSNSTDWTTISVLIFHFNIRSMAGWTWFLLLERFSDYAQYIIHFHWYWWTRYTFLLMQHYKNMLHFVTAGNFSFPVSFFSLFHRSSCDSIVFF